MKIKLYIYLQNEDVQVFEVIFSKRVSQKKFLVFFSKIVFTHLGIPKNIKNSDFFRQKRAFLERLKIRYFLSEKVTFYVFIFKSVIFGAILDLKDSFEGASDTLFGSQSSRTSREKITSYAI